MSWWQRLRLRRRRDDRDLDRELRYHVDRRIQDLLDAGLAPSEARRRVTLEFGDLDLAKDECRDARPLAWLDDLGRDLRIGFRSLRRERLFTLSVTLILALGIGVSVAMFSVLEAIVLRPLPYARAHELAAVSTHLIARNQWDGTSVANYRDWRAQSRTFAAMTCYRRVSVSAVVYVVDGTARRTQEGAVCADFFSTIGVSPLHGRTFTQEEFDAGSAVVVISERVWQEQFGRTPDAIGRTVTLNGANYAVIGVMPRQFQLPAAETDLWRPLSSTTSAAWWKVMQNLRDGDGIEVIGRLRPGIAIAEARAEMQAIAARLRAQHSENRDLDVTVVSLLDRTIGAQTARGVWIGFGSVISLLLIACANVGGLVLARSARRRREFVVRTALGAGRARLGRQLVVEGVCLWTLAGVSGLLFAAALIRGLSWFTAMGLPRLDEVTMSRAAVAFGAAGSFIAVLSCTVFPALASARSRSSELRTRDRAGLPPQRWQDVLVSGQIAGALALLVVAMLLAQSFLRASGEDPGYPADELLVARVDLPVPAYDGRAARARYFDAARERLARLPGVISVGAINDFVMRRNGDQRVTAEGRALADAAGNVPRLTIESVTPGFFAAVGIVVIEGREFAASDLVDAAPPVMIVSEQLARRLWPGESAIGKRLVRGATPPPDGNWETVVGVARDVRREGLDRAPILTAFSPTYLRGMDLTIRASSDRVPALAPMIRSELREIDRTVPLMQVSTVSDRLADRLAARRFESQATGLFAAIAMLLSATGLYALLSYQVTLRTREIGIRCALGADRRAIVMMIFSKGIKVAVVGAAVGVAIALASARLLQSVLYETTALDVRTYVAVTALVIAIACASALTPALRGAGVSPVRALRQD